jgi:hypothetical protein
MLKRILATLLAFCCFVSAKEQVVHWSDLARLITGKEVLLRLQDGKRVKGQVMVVTVDSIALQTRTGQNIIPRPSLSEIRLPKKASYKWRILGTAIGAGAGAAIAIPLLRYSHNEGTSSSFDAAAAGVVLGLAAVGCLAGWSSDRSGHLIRVLPD